MKKILTLAALLSVLSLTGCANQASSSSVKWVSPTGAPTLAFYDQGKNENWLSSSSPTTVVVPAFATNDYDAIVFDGVSGLNVIKKNSYNYKLAQWISGGNFYVVSTKHSDKSEFKVGQTIEAFVKTGNAAKAFSKLSTEKWGWSYADSDITFEDGVATVKQSLVNNPEGHDYYVVAEPILTAAKSALKAKNITLNTISNLQTDWKEAYKQATIPAAALFVNNDSYTKNKGAIDAFLAETQTRQDKAVDSISEVVTTLNAYGDDTEVTTRFGYTATLANALQKDGANKFGILKTGDITDKKAFANDFQTTLGGATFADSLFL